MNSVYTSPATPVTALSSRESTRDAGKRRGRLRGSRSRSGAPGVHRDRACGPGAEPGCHQCCHDHQDFEVWPHGQPLPPAARSGRCLVLAVCGESAGSGQRKNSSSTFTYRAARRFSHRPENLLVRRPGLRQWLQGSAACWRRGPQAAGPAAGGMRRGCPLALPQYRAQSGSPILGSPACADPGARGFIGLPPAQRHGVKRPVPGAPEARKARPG